MIWKSVRATFCGKLLQIYSLISFPTVLYKADGVFLWVHDVLRSLRRGLNKHDDWDELQKRLEALPSRIEELFHDMWRRLNEDMVVYR